MTETTVLTLADVANQPAVGGVIRTPLEKLNELADFMANSGPMVGPSMQGHPERCRAVAYLADRWGMDPFSVSSEVFFFKNRDGKELMSFGAKLIVALVNGHAPLARPLHVAFEGDGGTRRAVVTGWLRGAEEPSVLRTPTVAQTRVKNSPLWRDDPDQQLSYAGQRAWARRYTPQAILGLYAPEEMAAVQEVQEVAPVAERAAALFDDSLPAEAEFDAEPTRLAGEGVTARVERALEALRGARDAGAVDRAWELTAALRDDLAAMDEDTLALSLETARDERLVALGDERRAA